MKKLSFLFLTCGYLFAQSSSECLDPIVPSSSLPCCNGIISTNPNFPNDVERTDVDLNSVYDWVYNNGFDATGGSFPQAANPFYLALTTPGYDALTNYQIVPFSFDTINMHPRYGWELLHANFNNLPFTNIIASAPDYKAGYHMIFYNRHTGKVRLFTYPFSTADIQKIAVNLELMPASAGNPGNQSAIFNHYNERNKALDQFANVTKVQSYAPTNMNFSDNHPAWMDFQFAYDPCVCLNENEIRLNFSFYKETEAGLYAEGKSVGITSPINNNGQNPLQFNGNWLASVYMNQVANSEYEAQHGFQIYNTINQLIEENTVEPGLQFLAQILNIAGGLLGGINISLDNPIPLTFLGINDSIKEIPLGQAISAGTGFFSSMINPPLPDIHFIESQIALRGTITTQTNPAAWDGFSLLHPGSKLTLDPSVPWSIYPFYNEAPGTFAILNTPVLYSGFETYQNTEYHQDTNSLDEGLAFGLKEEIQYAINPAAKINTQKSQIYASIEFDLYAYKYEDYESILNYVYPSPFMGIDTNTNIDLYPIYGINTPPNYPAQSGISLLEPSFHVVNVDTTSVVVEFDGQNYNRYTYKYTFQTPLLSIDKIHEYNFIEYFNNVINEAPWSYIPNTPFKPFDPRLKIISDFTFLPDQFGVEQKALQIFTYELQEIEINFSDFDNCSTYPELCNKYNYNQVWYPDTVFLPATHFTINDTIQASVVIIEGDISADPGIQVYIFGTNAVVIDDEVSINGSVIISDYDPFYDNQLNPQPAEQIKKFCTIGDYKANQTRDGVTPISNVPESNNGTRMKIYPNPTSDNANVRLEGWSGGEGLITIVDLTGRLVSSTIVRGADNETFYAYINLSTIAPGTYFVSFSSTSFNATEKLIVNGLNR